MQAETVYNVYQVLPETEKLRFYNMLEKEQKEKVCIKKADGHLTQAECIDALTKLFADQKKKRFGSVMKVV